MTDTEIEESVLQTVAEIWDGGKQWVPLTWTYCTECGLDSMKQRCIGDIVTGECLCVRHFVEKRIAEKRRERDNEVRRRLGLEEEHKPSSWTKPKFDVEDFARI